MTSQPTLYLSNWSSHRTPGMHGPGRKFTIMARPRAWERGVGALAALVPPVSAQRMLPDLLKDRHTGSASLLGDVYRTLCEGHFDARAAHLYPGALVAYDADGFTTPAEDGDTLCCACSVAEARAGRCHRTWAAPFLVRAGWRVVLDGQPYASNPEKATT